MVDLDQFGSDGNGRLIHMEVRGSEYAVCISKVREVLRSIEIAPLPNSPGMIEGVADVRDALVPVIDLGKVLFGSSVEASVTQRIVLVEVRDMLLGLRVDRVFGVMQVDSHSIDQRLEILGATGQEMVCGMIRQPRNRPVMLLSLEDIVENVEFSERMARLEFRESVALP